MSKALAALETLRDVAGRLPEMTEEQKLEMAVEAAAKKHTVDKRGRRKSDRTESIEIFHDTRKTANSGPVDLMELMKNPPEGYEPRVWDPVTKQTLMRKGQIGSLAGPDKGGKTRIAVSLMTAMLDPTGKTPFLRYYVVDPLKEDQVVIHLALEEDETDMFAAWSPYLRADPKMAERVISISYSGVSVNLLAEEIRDQVSADIYEEVEKREKRLGRELNIGALVIDPLFSMAQGDYNKDPRLATDVFNDVLKRWAKDELGSEVVLVLAHTSKEGGKFGSEGMIYGSIGWASKMHFLWYVQKDIKQDDYRLFGANRGRADTYGHAQHLYMLGEESGDPEELWGQLEVRPEEADEAARERVEGRTGVVGARGLSKTQVLRAKLEERLRDADGEPVGLSTIVEELSSEVGRLEVAGMTVKFASSPSAISKVLKTIVEDGLAATDLVAVPGTSPAKTQHAWKATPTLLRGGTPVEGTMAAIAAAAAADIKAELEEASKVAADIKASDARERAKHVVEVKDNPILEDGTKVDRRTGEIIEVAKPPSTPAPEAPKILDESKVERDD